MCVRVDDDVLVVKSNTDNVYIRQSFSLANYQLNHASFLFDIQQPGADMAKVLERIKAEGLLPCSVPNRYEDNVVYPGYLEYRRGRLFLSRFFDSSGKLQKEIQRFDNSESVCRKSYYRGGRLLHEKRFSPEGDEIQHTTYWGRKGKPVVMDQKDYHPNGTLKKWAVFDPKGQPVNALEGKCCAKEWDRDGNETALKRLVVNVRTEQVVVDLLQARRNEDIRQKFLQTQPGNPNEYWIPVEQTLHFRERDALMKLTA